MASTSAARAARPGRVTRSAQQQRPSLTVLARPEPARSPLPFTVLCTLIVVGTLVALLLLNIQMSDASYKITRLQSQSQRLTEESQALQETNARLGTPQELEKSAREIGMVPVGNPAYIDLSTGTVMGESSPAGQVEQAPALPAAHVVPPARLSDSSTAYRGMGNEGV